MFLYFGTEGNWTFPWGMYDGTGIVTEPDGVFTGKSANSFEAVRKFSDEVFIGTDGLGCCWGWIGLEGLDTGFDSLDRAVHLYHFQALACEKT